MENESDSASNSSAENFRAPEKAEYSEARLQEHEHGLNTLKKIIDSTDDPKEKAFFTRPHVVASILGLSAESGFKPESAKILRQGIQRANATTDFAFLQGGNERYKDIAVINIPASRRVIQENSSFFGANIEDGANNDTVINKVKDLYNKGDNKNNQAVQGLFSGFPLEDVQNWTNATDVHASYRLEEPNWDVLGGFFDSPPTYDSEQTGFRRSAEEVTRDTNLTDFSPNSKIDEGRVSYLGVTYKTTNPPTESSQNYIDQLTDMDNKLGISNYISEVRSSLPQTPS